MGETGWQHHGDRARQK